MKKSNILLLSLAILSLSACDFTGRFVFPTDTDETGEDDDTGGGTDNPGPGPVTPPGPEETYSFTPEVGQFRKLFTYEEGDDSRFYNYCPSSFVENNERHIYFCTNKINGNITDYVGYRKATMNQGTVTYGDVSYTVSPGEIGEWDSRHACDPSVVKGEFSYKGTKYNYLMAYLGCISNDCTLNETGIAVAKKPEGPWIKCDKSLVGTKISPIVSCNPERDPNFTFSSTNWGTGQPSLVSYDGQGKVLLFTTIGSSTGTFTDLRLYDFSNIDNYQLLNERTRINVKGVLTSVANQGNIINNADFAYDPVNKRILMVKDRIPSNTDGQMPTCVSEKADVYYIDDSQGVNPGDVLFAGNNTTKQWKWIGTISEENSGQFRNHNCGLLTDEYGHVLEDDRIGVMFTKSDAGNQPWPSLGTYRLYETAFAFPDEYYLNK